MKKSFLFAFLILLLSISLFGCAKGEKGDRLTNEEPSKEKQQQIGESDRAAVAGLVEDFGKKIQAVSLQAPEDVLKKSMQENYGNFASPALIAEWVNAPQNAPGRLTSSPWPDHIEILSIKGLSKDAYEVKGEIIEITGVEKVKGGVAAKRPISLVVKKIENHWLIDAVMLGDYKKNNSIVYKNTQYGFSFSLPGSWKGYTVVTGQWEGRGIEGSSSGETVETGPLISLRHPRWTSQNRRQDIPIMIFTLAQWKSLQQGEFHISAAPIGPKALDRNPRYLFALPARYNYAFLPGYKEVESILANNPLRANETKNGVRLE